MARWCDEITLITEQEPQEKYNENGFANASVGEIKRIVFCNKRSISQNEYYKAQQSGKQVEIKVEVHTVDYEGENLVELEGKRYTVLKNYAPEDSDITELTLTDLAIV